MFSSPTPSQGGSRCTVCTDGGAKGAPSGARDRGAVRVAAAGDPRLRPVPDRHLRALEQERLKALPPGVCVCPGGAASCAACARSRCICARLMLGCGVQLQSMSFAHVLFDGFDLKYADTADLRGYIGQDIVQLGHYYARTKFGCITRCDSADFNGVDGVEKKARSHARTHARTLARTHARTHTQAHACSVSRTRAPTRQAFWAWECQMRPWPPFRSRSFSPSPTTLV